MKGPRGQAGMSLVMAMFVLTGLAALGAALVQMLNVSDDSVAREVVATRALFAAESGAQRGLNEVFLGAGCDAVDAVGSYSFPALAGCGQVTVSCTQVNVDDDDINYYTIVSTGTCGPAANPAVRTIEVMAHD